MARRFRAYDDHREGGGVVSATDDTPRRLTPTERLHEVTMAAMHRQPSPPEHAVEVSRNAKGVAQFTVTVRGHDLDEVLLLAMDSYDKLGRRYPYPDETNGAKP